MQIGIDLGGTKIEGIALGRAGEELARQRVPTPLTYDLTIAAIVSLVAHLEATTGQRGTVGVGIPGAVMPDTGLVKNANSVWLIGRPLGTDLAAQLGRDVRLDNDANCFALSEATDGAGAGARVVFGVIADSIFFSSMFIVSGRRSTKTGTAPRSAIAFAHDTNVNEGKMTSSPGSMPTPSRARCSATVPFVTATTCSAPMKRAKSLWKRSMNSPFEEIQVLSRHCWTYAISLPPSSGR